MLRPFGSLPSSLMSCFRLRSENRLMPPLFRKAPPRLNRPFIMLPLAALDALELSNCDWYCAFAADRYAGVSPRCDVLNCGIVGLVTCCPDDRAFSSFRGWFRCCIISPSACWRLALLKLPEFSI